MCRCCTPPALGRKLRRTVDHASPERTDRHPVLLVHGIWKSGAAFRRMAAHLTQRGFAVHTLDLVPNDGAAEIPALAEQVASFIEKTIPEGSPLDLLGFSMGGVVSRYYVQRLGGAARVRRFITISAPHHGTLTAYLARKPGAVQLRPNSPLLAELNRDLSALTRLDVTTMWTPLDLMILPPESSRLGIGREVVIAAPLHALMLHDPRALRAVEEALSAPLAVKR
jgi:triacylglycerol lipase